MRVLTHIPLSAAPYRTHVAELCMLSLLVTFGQPSDVLCTARSTHGAAGPEADRRERG